MRLSFLGKKASIRLAISLFFFSHGLILSSWASRIPYIKNLLSISDAELGTLLLLMPMGQIVTMPLSAKWVDRFGSKTVIKYSYPLYGLLLLVIGLCTNYYQLAFCLFLVGVLGNLCNISINTQAVEYETLRNKPMIASFHGVWSISGFVGALIGMLMLNIQTTSLLLHFSLILLIVLLIYGFNLKLLLQTTYKEVKQKQKGSIFKYLDKTLIQLGLIGFLSMSIEGALFDWSGVYFQDIVQAPEQWVIVGYTSFVLMMAFGRFLGDTLVARLGRKTVIQLSGILMSVGLLLAVFFPSFAWCTLAFMLVGLGGSCSVPTVYGVAGKYNKISPSIALTLLSTISFLGFLLGPPLIGFIGEHFDLRYSFFLFSFFGLGMVVLAQRTPILKDLPVSKSVQKEDNHQKRI